MRFGHFDLDIDSHRFVRIINTALLVCRDANQSTLTDQKISSVMRRIQVAIDVLALRLQARAPLSLRGLPQPSSQTETNVFFLP